MNNITRLVVHAGIMHMDDLLCAAIVKYFFPLVSVLRVNKVEDHMVNDTTVICDIGGKYDPEHRIFDHHNDCPTFADGTKHAAIGLLLMNMSEFNIPERLMKDIEIAEYIDNGNLEKLEGYHVLNIARVSNPSWDSDESTNVCFEKAVNIVLDNYIVPLMNNSEPNEEVLEAYYNERVKDSERALKAAEEIVMTAYNASENKEIIILPVFAPWQCYLIPTEAKFVVYPSLRGGYNLQCVPEAEGNNKTKISLPDWNTTTPVGMTFEHPARFMASFDTIENAINAAKEVI